MNPEHRIGGVSNYIWHRINKSTRPDERDIQEDLYQEAVLSILETKYEASRTDMRIARNRIKNFLDKWRERGYKTTLWQNSVEELD